MATYPNFSEPTSYSRGASSDDTAAGLLTRLMNDVTALFRNEVALAKHEFSDAANKAKLGVGGIAVGGAVAFGGYLALLSAAVLGLANVMEPWLAALIVGVAAAVIGFVMIKSAQKKLEPSAFRLERTQESLRKDVEVTRRHV